MEANDIVIAAAKRTPIGSLLGNFSSLSAPQLSAFANQAVLEQALLEPESIDETILGCVLQAGIGQAPARQASILAKIPANVPATTINKMCGSGMKAVMLAFNDLKINPHKIFLTGGMESMTNAPFLVPKVRQGYRLGHQTLIDSMLYDGLEDAYNPGKAMGYFAEQTAAQYHFTRDEQDAFAKRSLEKALKAQASSFRQEIVPIPVIKNKTEIIIDTDEGPDRNKLEKITRLKPVFQVDGTITAANSSSISDGAASLIITTFDNAIKHNIKPLAKIAAHSSHAQAPEWFTTAPIKAIELVLEKADWHQNDIDLFEINEAFAVVVLAAVKALNIPLEKVNINGGACALGHPIGASGARIIVTLLYALLQNNLKRGVAALCIGGGEATACAIEIC